MRKLIRSKHFCHNRFRSIGATGCWFLNFTSNLLNSWASESWYKGFCEMADFLFYSFVHSECYINGSIITFLWASVARLCFSSIAWTILSKSRDFIDLRCFRRRIRMFWLFLTTYKSTVRVNIFSTFAKGKRHRESRTRRSRRARFKRKEKKTAENKAMFPS